MQTIRIHNTLSGQKEEFKPLTPGQVKIYACGITVYDHCHIGHAMQAIYFDMICRYFKYAGYQTTYVRNYTDVDDKIILRAKENNELPLELSKRMIESCEVDMKKLGIQPPTHAPQASTSMDEIIAMVGKLIDQGYAYATKDGDVYFRVRKKEDYGKLSNRCCDDMRSGTRDIVRSSSKEDELDFALWKSETVEGAQWESPWGLGRPGWHIECSAMAKAVIGSTIDIHGGGRDLIFPHHENEIAQSEGANAAEFARYWMHSGLLTIEKQKMSKSLGNHIPINQFLNDWPAEVLRLSFLERHYRSNVDFSKSVFEQAQRRLAYYYETLSLLNKTLLDNPLQDNIKAQSPWSYQELSQSFFDAMNDDFGTPKAIALINKIMRTVNQLVHQKLSQPKLAALSEIQKAINEWAGVLGILKQVPEEFCSILKNKVLLEINIEEKEIAQKIAERQKARSQKDWATSDQIRDELASKGIQLNDLKDGSMVWQICEPDQA